MLILKKFVRWIPNFESRFWRNATVTFQTLTVKSWTSTIKVQFSNSRIPNFASWILNFDSQMLNFNNQNNYQHDSGLQNFQKTQPKDGAHSKTSSWKSFLRLLTELHTWQEFEVKNKNFPHWGKSSPFKLLRFPSLCTLNRTKSKHMMNSHTSIDKL